MGISKERAPTATKDDDTIVPDTSLSACPLQADRNRFDRMEWAGAFGDLGTLIPFVLAYVSVMGLNSLGMLFSFGICMVASGLWYRTPFPVQQASLRRRRQHRPPS
jgi:hypothetical protein